MHLYKPCSKCVRPIGPGTDMQRQQPCTSIGPLSQYGTRIPILLVLHRHKRILFKPAAAYLVPPRYIT